jgi:DNA polymerase family B, exonuclease domain
MLGLMLQAGRVSLQRREDMIRWAEPRICAFDIETTKLPLQFPNAEYDQVGPHQPVPTGAVILAVVHYMGTPSPGMFLTQHSKD